MPRGGARAGSGRKRLWRTPECIWIIKAVRWVFAQTEFERQNRWEKKELSKANLEATQEVNRNIQTLKKQRRSGRPISYELLKDIRLEFEMGHVSRGSFIPVPTQQDKSRAYRAVAKAASKHFAKRVTRQQVERCVGKWLALEKRLDSDVV